jgi:hypothetical protein
LLSDGQELALRVGRERFHCGELLFRPELFSDIAQSLGVVDLVVESLHGVDTDLWPLVLSNVLLVGQTSRIPGFAERLTVELKAVVPEHAALVNVRVVEEGGKGRAKEEGDGEDRNQDPVSPSSLTVPAVSRAVAAYARTLVERQEGWMSADAYSEFGAGALEMPEYSYLS